jgi:DNA-binding response OmpR family regulator
MRVLIVEDHPETRQMVEEALQDAGFAVDAAADAEYAATMLRVSAYDAVVLDWMLPDGSGIDFCRDLRRAGQHVPVLMLTARGDVADRVAGLNAGADDYLRKPFAVAELIARLRALTRRRGTPYGPVARLGEAEVDLAARKTMIGGHEVPLTAREFSLLESLLSRRGRAVSRAEILRMVWAEDTPGAEASLEVLISRLRRKLSTPAAPCPIRTHRGFGYSVPNDE